MTKKKILSIVGISLGVVAIGFVTVRIISRWNKEIIEDWKGTILVSKNDYSNVESIGWEDESEFEVQEQSWGDLTELSDDDMINYFKDYDFLNY